MTENEFGDVLVDLMLRTMNFFEAHQTSMHHYSNSSWPAHGFYSDGYDFSLGGEVYMLQVKVNMVKKEPGQRDFKVINVWLFKKTPDQRFYSYYSAPKPYLFWLQDDLEFGFDYRLHVPANQLDEIAKLITDVIFPGLMEIEPALILQMMADL